MHPSLVTGIKQLARLDPAQQYRPQHARITISGADRSIDVRVSTMPTEFGERVVLRLLSSPSEALSLSGLGLSVGQRVLIENALDQPQGLILVAGPVGAGRSTTLRSLHAHRRPADGNLLAVEIHDRESARIAFEQSQTGHLVLSSVPVNNSLQAIERVLDLGVAPSLVSAALRMIIVQRLARRTCSACREPYEPSRPVLQWLNIDALRQFERGRGCVRCGDTGYSGRIGIFEVVNLTSRFSQSSGYQRDAKRAAGGTGARFLLDDALDKMYRGLTTVEEVMRAMRNRPFDNHPASAAALLDPGAKHTDRLGRLAS
jgi:type II secretory ATPase GspE/PulE/Tfp pilus assembly ATPase PilB-like protein